MSLVHNLGTNVSCFHLYISQLWIFASFLTEKTFCVPGIRTQTGSYDNCLRCDALDHPLPTCSTNVSLACVRSLPLLGARPNISLAGVGSLPTIGRLDGNATWLVNRATSLTRLQCSRRRHRYCRRRSRRIRCSRHRCCRRCRCCCCCLADISTAAKMMKASSWGLFAARS